MKIKKLSNRAWFLLVTGVLLAVVLGWRLATRPPEAPQVSQDPLSVGIGERWGAALPDGFTKISVEHITGQGGYLFARLRFQEDVGELLARWAAPEADTQARFDAIVDAQLADPATTPEEEALIEANRPAIAEGDIWFSLVGSEDERDTILLLYRAQSREMYIAEQQLA